MRKKLLTILLLLALPLLPAVARAESTVYEGSVVAESEWQVVAEASGTLESIDVRRGQQIQPGDVIGKVASTKVYATQDGTVAHISRSEGDMASGTILQLASVSPYTIYCTVDSAYQSAAATRVRIGETVYIKCTVDGTHRAIGVITEIDGSEYRVIATAGELYVGETVYLYRTDDYASKQKIGIGTVVSSDVEAYAAEGYITDMYVEEGEIVERGELLYEYVQTTREDGSDGLIRSDVSGIAAELHYGAGDVISQGEALLTVAADVPMIEIYAAEAEIANLQVGQPVIVQLNNSRETQIGGTVQSASWVDEQGGYRVVVQPESAQVLKIGMSVTVFVP